MLLSNMLRKPCSRSLVAFRKPLHRSPKNESLTSSHKVRGGWGAQDHVGHVKGVAWDPVGTYIATQEVKVILKIAWSCPAVWVLRNNVKPSWSLTGI